MNFDVPPTNSNSLTLEIPSDSSNSPHIAQAKEDLKSYLSEYSPAKWDFFGRCFGSANEKQLVGDYIIQFAEQVNTHDIVVFAKVGCGFCLRAKNALGERSEVDSFSMHVINVKGDRAVSGAESSAMQEALKKTINLYDLTFPQIVIKGRYVGGADTLLGLIDDNMFSSVLSEPRCRFEAGDKITWLRSLAEEVSGANNSTQRNATQHSATQLTLLDSRFARRQHRSFSSFQLFEGLEVGIQLIGLGILSSGQFTPISSDI